MLLEGRFQERDVMRERLLEFDECIDASSSIKHALGLFFALPVDSDHFVL